MLPDAIHPRKEIQDGRSQLIQMRSILERVRLLCELVKKREKQKKELVIFYLDFVKIQKLQFNVN